MSKHTQVYALLWVLVVLLVFCCCCLGFGGFFSHLIMIHWITNLHTHRILMAQDKSSAMQTSSTHLKELTCTSFDRYTTFHFSFSSCYCFTTLYVLHLGLLLTTQTKFNILCLDSYQTTRPYNFFFIYFFLPLLFSLRSYQSHKNKPNSFCGTALM